ncbi:RNA polymerase sigma factor (sigma-70 family) [Catalinimonas alkaloidigena]|uniref:RNA polymerase sigma factor n=1 Tax=Catalinimonas alkaloidigena TaxID=1075417 RepID=UPI00240617CB|nr:sigma-70 family RNA polymerase sigma factor [Catalinimonas alkaloidigena]MDF9798976.1 RNA polymerase sigma factor (sigma-70 family) [Catalinimonas alkaloidigena]
MTDEQIWEAFKSGDRMRFEEIFRAHIRVLYKYGSRFTYDPTLVEDCIQDLFLDLWQKRSTLGSTDSIKRYLLGALRRRIIRKLQQKPAFHHPLDDAHYDFALVLNIEEHIISEEKTTEKRAGLEGAMVQLSKRQREVIYLKYFQQLSYDEIAEVMHITYQAARNLVYQSLKVLKQYAQLLKLVLVGVFANFL